MLPIVKEPASVLRGTARDIAVADISSRRIQNLIRAMKHTLKHTPDGVGLAAPQVGFPLRLFIISEEAEEIDRAQQQKKEGIPADETDTSRHGDDKPYLEREWKYYVFINPRVLRKSRDKIPGPEGCLSVPKIFGTVQRHMKISVTAHDEHGKKITRGAARFFARVMQHELDHLEGVLFIDKAKGLLNIPERAK